MTARARFYDVAVDPAGRPIRDIAAAVYQTGTTTPISATIYAAATGSTTLSNPITANDQGEVEFYLIDPATVDIAWSKAGWTSETHTVAVVAGEPYVPTSQRGTANGVATLDGTGVVPVAQLPGGAALDAEVAAAVAAEAALRTAADALLIPLAQRGAANGVATLDGSVTIPDAQIPAAIARDAEVTTAVAGEATARATAVTGEATARAAADSAHAASATAHLGTYVALVAAPTGVAATDTAVIAAALTAASSAGGGTVQLAAGTYLVNATLTIPDGVTLRGSGPGTAILVTGAGKGTVIKTTTALDPVISMTGGVGRRLENLQVDGQDTAVSLVQMSGYQNQVKNNDLRRATTYGVLIKTLATNNHENQVIDNLISMNGMGTCMRIGDSTATFTANDNLIQGNVMRGGLRMLHLYYCGANIITQNHFYAYPAVEANVLENIFFEGAGQTIFANNYIDSGAGGPMVRITAISSSAWAYDLQILGNFFYNNANLADNTWSAIYLDASVASSRVDRIIVAGNSFSYFDVSHRAKYLLEQTGSQITGITFSNNVANLAPGTALFNVPPAVSMGNAIGTTHQSSTIYQQDSTGTVTPFVIQRIANAGRLLQIKTEAGSAVGGIDSRGCYRAPDGDNTNNGLAFEAEAGMGLHRISAGILGFSGAAAETARLSATGLILPAAAVVATGRAATASRPSAATAGAGAVFYDSTISKAVWSDGTNWRETAPPYGVRPTAAIRESIPRPFAVGDQASLTSAQLYLVALYLEAGLPVTSITFVSSTTPAGTPLNQWFGLFDNAATPAMLRLTGDDTTTAWAANTAKTLALSSQFTPTYSGFHYVGIMVKATTVPTLRGVNMGQAIAGLVPVTAGTSTGSLTNPASCPNPVAALSTASTMAYCYVS